MQSSQVLGDLSAHVSPCFLYDTYVGVSCVKRNGSQSVRHRKHAVYIIAITNGQWLNPSITPEVHGLHGIEARSKPLIYDPIKVAAHFVSVLTILLHGS